MYDVKHWTLSVQEHSTWKKSQSHYDVVRSAKHFHKADVEKVADGSLEHMNETQLTVLSYSRRHMDVVHLKMFVDCRDIIHHCLPVWSLRCNDVIQILHSENSLQGSNNWGRYKYKMV